jgi:LmbE family N-acetylglucosaminyl deacetylase
MKPLLVISPHLDDAVLSVGEVIAAHDDVVVATVFAGNHPSPHLLTAYDKTTGFDTSQAAMERRRGEDVRAMHVLDATPMHGDFLDQQYGVEQDRAAIHTWVKELADDADDVLVPLGIMHPDHLVVGAETREATRFHDNVWMYEELPYRVQYPENVAASMAVMRKDGWTMELGNPFPTPPDSLLHRKIAAMECYRSQITPEMIRWSSVPERIWSLKR